MSSANTHIEKAWNEYSKQLHEFIRARVNSQEEAEDILANVFLKLVNQTESSQAPYTLSNWLYRVTRNTIIDFYRSKKALDSLPQDLVQEMPDPEAIATLSRCIMPIIEELPEPYRLPILLSEIQEKKQSEVAKALGLTLPALKSRILRGRQKLKDIMSKRCTYEFNHKGQLVDYKEKTDSH